jgi:hypothetical protein
MTRFDRFLGPMVRGSSRVGIGGFHLFHEDRVGASGGQRLSVECHAGFAAV